MSEEMKERPDSTWSDVVESDEVFSEKTGKWYAVESRATTADGAVRVRMVGIPKTVLRKPIDPVRLRRGATGRAVDMMVSILYSGPSRENPA